MRGLLHADLNRKVVPFLIALFALVTSAIMSCLGSMPKPVLSLLLIAAAVYVFKAFGKIFGTILNLNGLFSLVWLGVIGLASLGLHPAQVGWTPLTWSCIVASYLLFEVGVFISQYEWVSPFIRVGNCVKKSLPKVGLYTLASIFILCFIADCLYSGGLPIFSELQESYQDFGMPFVHYVTVAGCAYPALCYVAIKDTLVSKREKQIIFALASFVGLFPLLDVSRMQLFTEVIIFFVAWFICGWREKRIRFIYLVAGAAVFLLAWLVLSLFRNQDPEYLSLVFQVPIANEFEATIWQVYLYLTMNFDNFNNFVSSFADFTNGAAVLGGVLPRRFFNGAIGPNEMPQYFTLPTYNTFSSMALPYEDFGLLGVSCVMLAIGLISGWVEKRARTEWSPAWIAAYGLIIYATIMMFFFCPFLSLSFWADLGILYCFARLAQGAIRCRQRGSS